MAAIGQFDSAFVSILSAYRLDSVPAQSTLFTRIAAVEALMQERENAQNQSTGGKAQIFAQ